MNTEDYGEEGAVTLGDMLQARTLVVDELVTEALETERRRMRHPPTAPALERELIADLIAFGVVVLRAGDEVGLSREHFADSRFGDVYGAARGLDDRGTHISLATLADALLRDARLDDIGGQVWLEGLLVHAADASQVGHVAHRAFKAAEAVLEKAQLRGAIDVAQNIAARAFAGGESAAQIVDSGVRALAAVEVGAKDGVVDNRNLVRRLSTSLVALGGKRAVIGTGFGALDRFMDGGFAEGELVIIAARPSMGKTACVLGMATHLAVDKQRPVYFASLEMDAASLVERIAGAKANVPTRSGVASRPDAAKLMQALGSVGDAPLHIDETPGLSAGQLRARARAVNRRGKLAAVIVDYLQLMGQDGQRRGPVNTNEDLGETTKALKNLARELSCPVICLSQLNRGVETRPDKRPMMSDLRGSGAIEQDADVIAFLYREEYYARGACPADKRGVAEVIIAKNRNGPAGRTVRLRYDGDPPRFRDLPATSSVDEVE